MPSINGITVTSIKGSPTGRTQHVDTWTQYGKDGRGFVKTGSYANETNIVVVKITTISLIKTVAKQLRESVGKICIVSDDIGRTYNLLIIDVSAPDISTFYIPPGNEYQVRGEFKVKGYAV